MAPLAHHIFLFLICLAGLYQTGPCTVCTAHLSFALFCNVPVLLTVEGPGRTESAVGWIAAATLQPYQRALINQPVRCLYSTFKDQGGPMPRTLTGILQQSVSRGT